VSVRPIKLISGSSPFCETFFDDARAEKSNLIGEEGKGWTIAKYLLTHEREMISGFGTAPKKSVGQLALESMGADTSGRLANGILRQTIAQYQLDTMAFGATMARVGDDTTAPSSTSAATS
jgi:alkylation response protein AidB-like acyl-CoA dehydrogenase